MTVAPQKTSAGLNHSNRRVESADGAIPHQQLPELSRDRSFWAMAITQFLGAFNDNLFKQLILLLATPTLAQAAAGSAKDVQSNAQFVFAAAFLIFSGFAGYLSDRYSKSRIVVICKVAEIFVALMGMIGFVLFDRIGVNGMFFVLFLMGMHSAFFGPAKYGILPEMIRANDLPRANGLFLMLTFLAIIFGMALAGALLIVFQHERIWLGSLACIVIAIFGTVASMFIRRLPPANASLNYDWSCWLIPRQTLQLMMRNKQLLAAVIVVAIFWMVGGVVLQTVNALGKTQLGLNELQTSVLNVAIGLGTSIGCMLGGYLSHGRINRSVVVGGAVGTVVSLIVMSLPGSHHDHLLGFYGSIPVLMLLGTFSGMFIVPVQVALQSLPPPDEKGRMIATMNQFSWAGVILGAIVYKMCIPILDTTGWPRASIFAVTALLMVPVAIFYRPKDEQLADAAG
jgi:acyl-[acyl-carrier-protein]-phospholipid O-acyltransferase/long-chain-fatty-acid--[acyl-carrier-protein] ligase